MARVHRRSPVRTAEERCATMRFDGQRQENLSLRLHVGPPLWLHGGMASDRRVHERRWPTAGTDAGVCSSNGLGYRPGDSAPFGEPQPWMDDGVELSVDRAREPLVAHCPDRSHCATGGAGPAPQPTGRSQSARRAPQGDSGRAKSPRPRHPRQPGAGVCRDSDAVAGGSARGRQHAAGRRVEYSHCR